MVNLQRQSSSDLEFLKAVPESSWFAHGSEFSTQPALSDTSSVTSWRYVYAKRFADIIISSAMMGFVLIPCMLIAIAIAFSSEGPIFYRETRIGRGGRAFRIWKFRTMCRKAESREVEKANDARGTLLHWRTNKNPDDPRVTPVGRALRRWSLDELPQILNVLVGDMSLIGPRPVVAAEVPLYKHLQRYYLAAVPGLSGLWQVSGRSNLDFAKRAALDANYVRNWSLRSDLRILFQTIPAVLNRVGAH